jgi:hypothetical protein
MSEVTHDTVCDLMARMLTCASYIEQLMSHNRVDDLITVNPDLVIDAGKLLIEATSVLEQLRPPPDLGPPMEIIKPTSSVKYRLEPAETQAFTDPGVPDAASAPSARTCPQCDSRANKTVRRVGDGLELECPVCGKRWNYRSKGKAKWV